MNTDLTFITNEKDKNLADRFRVLVKSTKFFDILVGYFYISGFYKIYRSLEKTKKIRILIGISTNKQVIDLIQESKGLEKQNLQFSHSETKKLISDLVTEEMENSKDGTQTEEGIIRFREWLRSGKLEIKAYPSENIHAKLYIMTFAEGDRDAGRIITGSSNFTQSGLIDNLEFNVELKNRSDYEFASHKFKELWEVAVDVKDKYLETIQKRTWMNDTITPYQLYLKFLYEYFKDEIGVSNDLFYKYLPQGFKKLEYQEQAVLNAKKILNQYGGVFLSDVVGLGKTYMSAMLAKQLDGRTLVIAPPMLLDKNNLGSWPNVFNDFNIPYECESIGKLDKLIKRGTEKYKNIFIDEAHKFRTETNITYEKLAQICRGKRVILVTATPFNNTPKDILSQIKLFQKVRKSNIPGLPDLEAFFNKLMRKIKKLDRKNNATEYIQAAKDNAMEIREKVLKYLMVRRTRTEIEKYFKEDIKKQKIKFPEVIDPKPIFYELDDEEDKIFDKTINLITKNFKYTRYTPMLYYTGEKLDQLEIQSQKNMGRFMKILVIKRLESSFYAFKNTINRFIYSYESVLREYDNGKGNVYTSKKYINKIFDLIESDDEVKVQKLIDEDKAVKYLAKNFDKSFQCDLEHDLNILKEIQKLWNNVERDPKLLKFIDILSSQSILKKNKLIIFTESKETAGYLEKNLKKKFPGEILLFSGGSSISTREKVIENFDARARFPKDDYRILVSTEVLSEGVNLHRSNVVINYDIPWNPTRLMQRVGRINRIDTSFDEIYTYNFFPTRQSNEQIRLEEAAKAKIHSFITLLGSDSKFLTEGESIESHELFDRLTSKKTITGENEEESELKYLQIIKNIRDNNPDLFDQIKHLPKKARTARIYKKETDSLLTYFRKNKLQKFFLAGSNKSKEIDFMDAAKLLETDIKTKREKFKIKKFYELLDKNKQNFEFITIEEFPEIKLRGGRDTATQSLKILKAVSKDLRQFTDDQEFYFKKVIKELEQGGLPKQTTKTLLKGLNKELKNGVNPLKILGVVYKSIPNEFLREHITENVVQTSGPREVILSEYFINK